MAKITSAGQVALRKSGHTQEQIAAATGASFALVGNWLTGARKPGPAYRDRLSELYSVRQLSWEESPPKAPRAPSLVAKAAAPAALARPPLPSAPPVKATPGDVLSEAAILIAQVRDMRDAVAKDPVATNVEKARVLGMCGSTLAQAYKLTGEGLDMPESKLLQTPAFRRVLDTMTLALEPWPDAMRALAAALEKIA